MNEEKTYRLIFGDCLKEMKKLSDNSVDMLLTDAPYGIANEIVISRGRNGMKFKGTDITHNFGEWDKFDGIKDFLDFTFAWSGECARILKAGGIFINFSDRDKINFQSHFLQQNNFKSKGYFAFIKSNPVPQARKVKFMNGWEMAGIWQKLGGELTFHYELGQQPDYYIGSICSGNERTEHPTQKPLKMFKMLVNYWSNENDTILDPFMGSGTTGVAALQLGRKFVGIEKEKKWFEIAERRIKAEANQLKMFTSE